MKIWERYFFCDTLKVLFFFLFALGGLFVLIDYASHTGNFHHYHTRLNLKELIFYYGGELIYKSEVLLPFAILIATIRVLTKLNTQNELVALLAAGIKMRRLLRPFLWIGFLGVLFLYLSEEVLVPWSKASVQAVLEKHTGEQSLKLESPAAHPVLLEDKTLLLFQTYNRHEMKFYDVWWIPSFDRFIRMKTLELKPEVNGQDIEIFQRLPTGPLISVGRLTKKNFPEIRFNQKRLLETLTQPEDLALSELAGKITAEISNEKEARVETAFWRKVFLPWLALFAVMGPAPFCLVFTRHLNSFLIYSLSVFSLVFIYILLNAAATLADRQVISPLMALLVPSGVIASLLSWRWYRELTF